MNKKGLSLVELLAVIAIIGLLAIMITPGIMSLRDSVLTSTLKSKVSQIENAAKDYGQEHINDLVSPVSLEYAVEGKVRSDNCIYRNVSFLVNNGYLSEKNTYYSEDDEEISSTNQIINPKTGDSMNNLQVCIRFDTNDPMNRQIVAYLVDFDYAELNWED